MSNTKISSEQIIDGVALAGNPTTTTQSAGNNTTRVATTAFVTTAVANIVDSAPAALNTLNEIAAAINDDANINTTLTNSIATKLALAGGTMTGTLNVTGDGEDVIINSADYELVLIGNRGSSGANLDKAYLRMKSEGTNVIVLDADGYTYLSGGNVGIGQAFGSTVDELLHVEKTSGTTIVKTEVAANSVVGFEIKKTGSTTSNWRLVDGQTVNGNLEIYDVTDSRSVMMFDGDGDIGMGVTPASNAKLTLGGTATSYSSVLAFDNNTTGGATFFMLASDNTWSAGGNKFLMGHGTPSSSAVDVAIDADGYLGINESSPDNFLHVNSGSTNVVAKFESTDGTAGIVLQDNGGNVELSALANTFQVQPAGGAASMQVSSSAVTLASGVTISQTVASGGGDFFNITHTGNEAWSFGTRSGSGSRDYLDVGIQGSTRSLRVYEGGYIVVGTPTQAVDTTTINGKHRAVTATDSDDATSAEECIVTVESVNGSRFGEWVHSTKAVAPTGGTQTPMISWYEFKLPGGYSGQGSTGFLEITCHITGMHASGACVNQFKCLFPNNGSSNTAHGGMDDAYIDKVYALDQDIGTYTTSLSVAFYYLNSGSGTTGGTLYVKASHAAREPIFTLHAKYIGGAGDTQTYKQTMKFMGTEVNNNHQPANITQLTVNAGIGVQGD